MRLTERAMEGDGTEFNEVYYVVVEASVDMDELQKDVFNFKAGAGGRRDAGAHRFTRGKRV